LDVSKYFNTGVFRLHRMQVRAVIIGVPLWIEIVVPPRKASVERPSFPGFLAIDLCVVEYMSRLVLALYRMRGSTEE
jgi:hypothetical protein